MQFGGTMLPGMHFVRIRRIMHDKTSGRQQHSAFDNAGERPFTSPRDDGYSEYEAGQRFKVAGKAADRSNRGGQHAAHEWDEMDTRSMCGVDVDNSLKSIESTLRTVLYSAVALTGAVTGWLTVSLAMEWL